VCCSVLQCVYVCGCVLYEAESEHVLIVRVAVCCSVLAEWCVRVVWGGYD